MRKAIKLMPDYGCYPLWYTPPYEVYFDKGSRITVRPQLSTGKFEAGDIDPQTLPLSPKTLARLDAWQTVFDETLNQEYPPDSDFKNPEQAQWFGEEGIALWKTLIAELPDYQVVYNPGDGRGVLVDPDHPDIAYRHRFDDETIFNKEVAS